MKSDLVPFLKWQQCDINESYLDPVVIAQMLQNSDRQHVWSPPVMSIP